MKEDPKTQCGWKWLSTCQRWLGCKKPEDDAFFGACEGHDGATSEGSVKQQISTLSKVQEEFDGDVDRIREGRYSGLGFYRLWASFDKLVTHLTTWAFWEGKK